MAEFPSTPPSFDAVLPPQMAGKAEDVGVAKASLPLLSMFMLAVLAGAFIALGAIFSTTVAVGAEGLPFGVGRVLVGLTFCLGLILVVVAGAELFTGNNLLVMAFVSGRISLSQLLTNWAVVYAGNLVGAVLTAVMMFFTDQYEMAGGALGAKVLAIGRAKCELGFVQAVALGVYCNALVCLAVWLCLSCRTTTDKILAILFPITAFVAAGFEHCVANMYFIPIALLVKAGAPDAFWASQGLTADDFATLTWGAFVWVNLLPVTLGNILGGSVMVGAVYWAIYQRRREE